LRDLFPKLEPTVIGEQAAPIRSHAPATNHFADAMGRSLDATDLKDSDPTFPALYQWLATHPPANDAIDTMRFRSWKSLLYSNHASLIKESPKTLRLASPCFRHAHRIIRRLPIQTFRPPWPGPARTR